MSKEIYISSTPHETRLAIVENDALTEIYYERENEYTLAGSIYNGKVTRVLPGMQSSFVDIGLERDAFLYITDFMEEAGDSADFDTSDSGRSPRRDGRDSRDRGDRSGNRELPAPTTLEGEAASGETPAASGNRDSSRGDRGRDRGGRGRRDRNRSGNRDRGDRERQPALDAAPPVSSFDTVDVPAPDFYREPVFTEDGIAPRTSAAEASEVGEGAPGADGSRRWRGRRGRRRGRGPGRDNLATPGTEPEAQSDDNPAGFDVETDFDSEPEFTPTEFRSNSSDIELDAAAARPLAPIAPQANGNDQAPRRDRDRGRSGRDRGGRDRGGRDRGDRGDRADRGPRVPRGFAPKTSLYGVDNTPAYGEPVYGEAPEAPAGEPIILPGESLSKYRKDAEPTPAAKTAANVMVPAPSTEFNLAVGWDGGATLPGESLSRHRRSESRQEPRAEHRFEPRTELRAAAPVVVDPAVQTIYEAHGPVVPQTQVDQPEIIEAAHPELIPADQILHAATPAPVAATPGEYEPTEASASFRVDPIAPIEYRQVAAPAEMVDFVDPTASLPEVFPMVADFEHPSHQDRVELEAAEAAVPAHDITHVQPTGEMISELPAIEPAPIAAQEPVAPASPIQHESAVVDHFTEPALASAPATFEEELIEDEDYGTIHASSFEELDDLDEEETLEGAADLGTMIREMTIDNITRPADAEEDALDEDDDLEEEDAIHGSYDEDDLEESDAAGEELYEGDADTESDPEGFAQEGFVTTEEAPASNGYDRAAAPAYPAREGDRSRRRDGRRDGRSRDGRGRDRDRSRSTGGAGDRERSGHRSGRQSMQATNLPAISDLLKPGQEVLVQIAKEPIAKKGARITSHIALPGRFLVFMPTVNHTGVSRKIESDGERRRLKEILLSEKGEASGGFIVRTAASGASEEELRSDLRFLLNLWADIKNRSESSKSPALIYHDLNLVERILRDQVTDNFSAIWVDTETDYERILRFLQRFQPSLIRRVKLYTKETPLFEQFGITEEINKALRSKVWLKSGGSIVINQTEALVAIDINTGKFVGKTARLEDTIVKTNLDAIPEIVRQIRLRDLGGIIIIDFIDMDERKNRNRVMAALEEELKTDRAPSKVLQFNDFGLVAITRKRVKQSLERTLSTTCNVCVGTGMVKSPVTVCNDIYIEMRKMQKHLDRGDVMLRVHPEVVKQLKSPTARWLQEMEEMVGKTILVKSDPALHPEQFDIH